MISGFGTRQSRVVPYTSTILNDVVSEHLLDLQHGAVVVHFHDPNLEDVRCPHLAEPFGESESTA